MSTYHGAVEELDQMRRLALLSKQLEKHLEDTRAAEPPEAFPDTVPFAVFGWQRAPGVNRLENGTPHRRARGTPVRFAVYEVTGVSLFG
jgi:hypothetical protein